MRKLTLLLIAVLLIAAAMPLAQAQEPVTLVIGTTDDISELDPAKAYSFHDWELLKNTNEGLMGYIPGEVNLEPRLAVGFPEVSEDGLTYTFTLRDDAAFPDGTAITPELYVSSVQRSLTLQGDPYGLIAMITDVAADGQNIVFTIDEPFDLFPIITALPPTFPAHPDIYPADDFNTQPDQLVGAGAYQIVEYTLGETAVLEKNPNYYGQEGAYDRIVFIYYEESTQLDLAIENGEIDMAWRSNTQTEVARLSEIENLDVLTISGGIRYLVFNHAMIQDANVRKGIAAAINRDEIVDRAISGLASPLYSMVPPGFLGASEAFLDVYGFGDADEARAHFEMSGYSADNKLAIDIWYPPNRYGGTVSAVMEVIEQQIEATGVVDVTLQSAEWSTYIQAATGGEYPIFFLGWFFDYPDSDNYLHPFASCAGSPGLGVNYCTDGMEALISAERSQIADPETRASTFEDLQMLYAEDVVTIPLFELQDFNISDNTKVANVAIGATLELNYRILVPAQ